MKEKKNNKITVEHKQLKKIKWTECSFLQTSKEKKKRIIFWGYKLNSKACWLKRHRDADLG